MTFSFNSSKSMSYKIILEADADFIHPEYANYDAQSIVVSQDPGNSMKVVVAFDDTVFSRMALKSVEQRCWPDGTEIFLCSVLDPGRYATSDLKQQKSMQAVRERWCQETLKLLEAQAYRLRQHMEDCTVTFDVKLGDVSEQICTFATEWKADVIIVGSHGRSGIRKHLLGSVAEAIVDLAPCDVEVIKSADITDLFDANTSLTTFQNQNRILLCINGSSESIASLNWVLNAHWTPNQEFTIISVIPALPVNLSSTRFTRALLMRNAHLDKIKQIKMGLNEYISILRKQFPSNKFHFEIREGEADECILQFTNEWGADLVILGAHDERLAIEKSHARKIAGGVRCSVKIIKAQNRPIEKLNLLPFPSSLSQRMTPP